MVKPGVREQPGRLTTVEVTFVLETFVTPSEAPCISAISFPTSCYLRLVLCHSDIYVQTPFVFVAIIRRVQVKDKSHQLIAQLGPEPDAFCLVPQIFG